MIHHKWRRWICDACGRTTYEALPWASENRGITKRGIEFIYQRCIYSSFTKVGGWMRAGIEPGVARLIPRVDIRQTKIGAIRLDIESGDHAHFPPPFPEEASARPRLMAARAI